jgi:hypothetical protein
VDEAVNFKNVTFVALTATNEEIQNEVQSSTIDAKTTTQDGFLFDTRESHFSYPFTINLSDTFLSNGDVPQVTSIKQQYEKSEIDTLEGFPLFQSSESNEVATQDSTEFVFSNGGYSLGPSTGQSSMQTYIYKDSRGDCYSRTLSAVDLLLTKVENQQECGW